jgi:ATP-binding protein involved in chromosome partitioning
MFRQLKVPVLGMIENMAFFDVIAYLRDRGGPGAHQLIQSKGYFDAPGDERVYIFGRGGARRKAEELGVPFLGEVPLNIALRESGDAGEIEQALSPGSPARPYLLGVVEQLAAQISIQNIKTPKMPKLEVIG